MDLGGTKMPKQTLTSRGVRYASQIGDRVSESSDNFCPLYIATSGMRLINQLLGAYMLAPVSRGLELTGVLSRKAT